MGIVWSILGLVASIYAPVVSYLEEPAGVAVTDNHLVAQAASAILSINSVEVPKQEPTSDEVYIPNEDDDYVARINTQIDASSLDNRDTSQTVDTPPKRELYKVIKVVDGDTLDVSINGKIEGLRLIGINTPETVDPRRPVQCFGVEASNRAKELLEGKLITLEFDDSQGERDKYARLLRYVLLSDGTNFNGLMISEGYAYEYTYNLPYRYQQEFKQAEVRARESKKGLWADGVCGGGLSTSVVGDNACSIKGNISSMGEKIYHMIGCTYYEKTSINEGVGEKWFCSEEEAESAGWRKAKNC